jgi:acyl-CoA thioesterase-1
MRYSTADRSAASPASRRKNLLKVLAALTTVGVAVGILAGVVSPDPAGSDTVEAVRMSEETPVATPSRRPAPSRTKPPADPPRLAVGSITQNPTTGRREVVVPDIRDTAVLIGDSQSSGPDTWPQAALRTLGYSVSFAGAGGTGFVAANGVGNANYYDSLIRGDWVLPHGRPGLVVIEGGGNDAALGASDAQILAGADALVAALRSTYPSSRLVMIGTLSRGAGDGGGRRAQVDALLGRFAAQRGIPFVSAGDWLTRHGLAGFLADRVHLNPQGHQLAAQVLEQQLNALQLHSEDTSPDPVRRRPHDHRPTA